MSQNKNLIYTNTIFHQQNNMDFEFQKLFKLHIDIFIKMIRFKIFRGIDEMIR